MAKAYLYVIVNDKDNIKYYGVTQKTPLHRLCTHYLFGIEKLKKDMQLYGLNMFKMYIIAEFDTIEQAEVMEAYVIKRARLTNEHVYNTHPGQVDAPETMKVPDPSHYVPVSITDDVMAFIASNPKTYDETCRYFKFERVNEVNPLTDTISKYMVRSGLAPSTILSYSAIAAAAMTANGVMNIEQLVQKGVSWIDTLPAKEKRALKRLYNEYTKMKE